MADETNQEWITGELRRAAVTERAPTHLRLQIDELSRRSSRQPSRRPARRFVFIPGVGALAALIVVLILALPGGTPGGPTVAQAAVVTAESASQNTPASLGSTIAATKEYASFAAIRFPSELDGGAWQFVSSGIVRVDGKRMLVIHYVHGTQKLAYAVLASPVLNGQKSGFSSLTVKNRAVVSWQESNHSCLLSSATVPRSTLLKLASS